MAGETACPPFAHEGDVPDGAHGPALDDEEEDLGPVRETGEDQEGPDEEFEEGGDAPVDDPEYGEADGDLDEPDAEDVEDLAQDGGVHGGGDLLRGKAVDVLAEAGVDEDVEPGEGYDCGYLLLEMAVSGIQGAGLV